MYKVHLNKRIRRHSNYRWSAQGRFNKILKPYDYLPDRYSEEDKYFTTKLDAQEALKKYFEEESAKKFELAEQGITLKNKKEKLQEVEEREINKDKTLYTIDSFVMR